MNKITADARDRMRKFLASHGPGIERRLLATRDDRVLFEVWRLALYYSDGKPKERIAVETSGFNAEAVLTEILQQCAEGERLRGEPGRIEVGEPPLLPAGDPFGG